MRKKSKKEAELEEFMQVMQPRTKKERTWINEDGPVAGPSSQRLDEPPRLKVGDDEDVSDDPAEQNDASEEVDDLEWMRRRMRKDLDLDLDERGFIQDEEEQASQTYASDSKVRVESLDLNH